MNANRQSTSPAPAHMIRAALLTGVLLFGAAVWYVNRSATTPRIDPSAATLFRFAFYPVLLGSIAGVYIVHTMRSRAAGYEGRVSLTVVGWAVGEGAALFGGVIYLLTGDPLPYLAGLILFLGALLAIGIPERSGDPGG